MAEMNSELVSTGFETTANSLEVTETGDFDGDGSLDALIFESQGGTAGSEQSYLVFYSQDDGTFHTIEITVSHTEEWKGKTSFVENAGITFIRYVLENGELVKVEDKTADVGKAIWKRTREELFPVEDEASEDKEVWFDIDDDGEDEMLVFSHDNSHANNFGQNMCLSRISWSDGHIIEGFALPFGGETFVFLNQSTNGMHDMLIDNSALFRWSGNQYEYWQFDGKKLTSK